MSLNYLILQRIWVHDRVIDRVLKSNNSSRTLKIRFNRTTRTDTILDYFQFAVRICTVKGDHVCVYVCIHACNSDGKKSIRPTTPRPDTCEWQASRYNPRCLMVTWYPTTVKIVTAILQERCRIRLSMIKRVRPEFTGNILIYDVELHKSVRLFGHLIT